MQNKFFEGIDVYTTKEELVKLIIELAEKQGEMQQKLDKQQEELIVKQKIINEFEAEERFYKYSLDGMYEFSFSMLNDALMKRESELKQMFAMYKNVDFCWLIPDFEEGTLEMMVKVNDENVFIDVPRNKVLEHLVTRCHHWDIKELNQIYSQAEIDMNFYTLDNI